MKIAIVLGRFSVSVPIARIAFQARAFYSARCLRLDQLLRLDSNPPSLKLTAGQASNPPVNICKRRKNDGFHDLIPSALLVEGNDDGGRSLTAHPSPTDADRERAQIWAQP